jgi:hypothetical protein
MLGSFLCGDLLFHFGGSLRSCFGRNLLALLLVV